jgi:hypothetical protein
MFRVFLPVVVSRFVIKVCYFKLEVALGSLDGPAFLEGELMGFGVDR